MFSLEFLLYNIMPMFSGSSLASHSGCEGWNPSLSGTWWTKSTDTGFSFSLSTLVFPVSIIPHV